MTIAQLKEKLWYIKNEIEVDQRNTLKDNKSPTDIARKIQFQESLIKRINEMINDFDDMVETEPY